MSYKFLTPMIHGLLDYTAAAALITMPAALDIGTDSPFAMWISVTAGALIATYSAVTDYDWGSYALISFRVHLALDLLVAAVFAIAPFVFGWNGVTQAYYLSMAAGVLMVVLVSCADNARIFIHTDSAKAD